MFGSNNVSLSILKHLYHSFVYPFLIYRATVWGNTKSYETTLHPIIGLQKKAVRIITFSPYRKHTSPIFKDLDIMKFLDVIYYLKSLCSNFIQICYLLPSLISLPLCPQGTGIKLGLLPDRRLYTHKCTRHFLPAGNQFAQKFSQVAQIFTKQSKRNECHTMH